MCMVMVATAAVHVRDGAATRLNAEVPPAATTLIHHLARAVRHEERPAARELRIA